jgi:hypothetical protein
LLSDAGAVRGFVTQSSKAEVLDLKASRLDVTDADMGAGRRRSYRTVAVGLTMGSFTKNMATVVLILDCEIDFNASRPVITGVGRRRFH